MLHFLAQASADQGSRALIDTLARTPLSQVVAFVAVCTFIRVALFKYLKDTPVHRRDTLYNIARFLNEGMDAVVYAGVFVFLIIRPFFVQAFVIPTPSMVDTLLVNDYIVANKGIYRYSDPKVGDIVVFKPPTRAMDPGQPEMDFIKRTIGAPGDVVEVREGKTYRNGQPVDEPFVYIAPGFEGFTTYDWKLVHYEGSYEPWRGKYIPVFLGQGPAGLPNYQTSIAREFAVGIWPNRQGEHSYPTGNEWKELSELTPGERQIMQELVQAPPAAIPPGHFLMMGDNRMQSYDSRGWGLVPRENIVGRSEIIWWPVSRWQKTK